MIRALRRHLFEWYAVQKKNKKHQPTGTGIQELTSDQIVQVCFAALLQWLYDSSSNRSTQRCQKIVCQQKVCHVASGLIYSCFIICKRKKRRWAEIYITTAIQYQQFSALGILVCVASYEIQSKQVPATPDSWHVREFVRACGHVARICEKYNFRYTKDSIKNHFQYRRTR